ncbi:MAG: ABC transporter permease, partial [Mesorhizobium sp.]
AGITILAMFVLIIDRILDIAEARLIKWSPHSTESRAT